MDRFQRAKKRVSRRNNYAFGLPRVAIFRDMSAAGSAADHLRRYGAVFRCGPDGKPNAKGGFWNRNSHVLTDDEIMSRASRLGWCRPEGVFAQ